MEEVIKEIFSGTYHIENLKKDGVVLVNETTENPSAVFIGWTNSFQSMKFDAAIGLLRFDSVENLLRPILKKLQISYPDFGGWTSTLTLFERVELPEFDKNNIEMLTEQFSTIKEQLKGIERDFFDKLISLGAVSEYLGTLNEEQLSERVTNPVLVRKLVIDTLSGNVADLKGTCNKIANEYEEAEKMYPQIFNNHNKATREVFNVLAIT
ncbi:hypothetical protein [Marinoscillum luteum]|jgi:hypothetical protein|uniref:Uncharacterized protein n=1 Tax=Marinoscillum luteum TaxID=861051 RepID=A0ABW7NCF6_9BACT